MATSDKNRVYHELLPLVTGYMYEVKETLRIAANYFLSKLKKNHKLLASMFEIAYFSNKRKCKIKTTDYFESTFHGKINVYFIPQTT